MANTIENLLLGGDSEVLEIKSARSGMDAVGRAVCGMLNQRGGHVVWGVGEDGQPQVLNRIADRIHELTALLTDQIAPRPLFLVHEQEFKGVSVIVVEVAAGEERPYSFEEGIWVRVGARTLRADMEDVGGMVRTGAVRGAAWEDDPVLGMELEHCDLKEIQEAREDIQRSGRMGIEVPDDDETLLERLYVIRWGQLTHAAAILFAREPRYWVKQSGIRLAFYLSGEQEPSHMQTIEGPAIRCLRETVDVIMQRSATMVRFMPNDPVRQERREFHLYSVREGLVNALVHRDYQRSGSITVSMYPDRLEIRNPADLPEDWSAAAEHLSRPHNPNIARVLLYRKWMEGLGKGLDRIRLAAMENGTKAPNWTYARGVMSFTLFKAEPKREQGLSDLSKRLLELLSKPQSATSLAAEVELSTRHLRRILAELEDLQLVHRLGSGPSTRYERTTEGKG